MTTSGGSVWDRGPSGHDGDRPDADRAAVPEWPEEAEPPIDTSAADPYTGDPSADEPAADEPTADTPADTVWSRGPAIDATPPSTLPATAHRRCDLTPVLPPASTPVSNARSLPEVRRPMAVVAGTMVVVLLGVLTWMLGIVGGDDVDPAIASGTSQPLMPVVSISIASPTTTAATATPVATTPVATTPVATTPEPSTTIATTTTSTTTTSTTTTSTTTSSTTSSTTTSTTTTVPEAPVGPQVAIVGTLGPCRYGNDCLIAGFTVRDFDVPQREFVCEFENGSRYTFRFDGVGAEQACVTSAADGTITIEVGGVRSETISR